MAGSEKGGFVIFPYELVDDEELPALEKAILLSLLRFLNREQQRAWPSIKHLAKINGLSHVCVIKILQRLEEKGYIRAEKKHGCVTRYEILTSKRRLPVNDTDQSTTFTTPVNEVYHTDKRRLPPPVNDVYTNNINRTRLKNNINEQEGRLLSPDPWIRDRLSEICQVVNAPKPANLDLLIGQWRETYGESTVEQTILKALRWMQDNGRQYTDMGRFIGNWLARDAKQPRPRKFTAPDYGDKPKSWRELMPAFYEEDPNDNQ